MHKPYYRSSMADPGSLDSPRSVRKRLVDGRMRYDPRDPDPGDPDPEASHGVESPFVSKSHGWTADYDDGPLILLELDRYLPYELLLTDPPPPWMEGVDVATVRLRRHGGPHPSDREHQQRLFLAVGMVAVIAGHVEAEMKRILLTASARAGSTFSDVDLTWSGLEKNLQKVANEQTGELADRLRPILEWGRGKKIAERRHDVIHSAWWLYNIGHLEASRFKRNSQPVIHTLSYEDVETLAVTMGEYLDRLAQVVPWTTAVLPPLAPDVKATGPSTGEQSLMGDVGST